MILLDFDLGENDGREFMKLTRRKGSRERFWAVTAGLDRGVATELIRSGISGVFLKRDSAALLAQGIREVMAGKVWFEQDLLRKALEEHGGQPERRRSQFSERERQVLSLVFEGSCQ